MADISRLDASGLLCVPVRLLGRDPFGLNVSDFNGGWVLSTGQRNILWFAVIWERRDGVQSRTYG